MNAAATKVDKIFFERKMISTFAAIASVMSGFGTHQTRKPINNEAIKTHPHARLDLSMLSTPRLSNRRANERRRLDSAHGVSF
ncbi:MAG TPA: hypothetical protein VH598_11935 [Verrucomicrobiae bacterium]|nr:hypothetical protein [Verrucomicrobiae bacterium]